MIGLARTAGEKKKLACNVPLAADVEVVDMICVPFYWYYHELLVLVTS